MIMIMMTKKLTNVDSVLAKDTITQVMVLGPTGLYH